MTNPASGTSDPPGSRGSCRHGTLPPQLGTGKLPVICHLHTGLVDTAPPRVSMGGMRMVSAEPADIVLPLSWPSPPVPLAMWSASPSAGRPATGRDATDSFGLPTPPERRETTDGRLTRRWRYLGAVTLIACVPVLAPTVPRAIHWNRTLDVHVAGPSLSPFTGTAPAVPRARMSDALSLRSPLSEPGAGYVGDSPGTTLSASASITMPSNSLGTPSSSRPDGPVSSARSAGPTRTTGTGRERGRGRGRGPAALPPGTLQIYADHGHWADYAPSGRMGDLGDLGLDDGWPAQPHSGATSIRNSYAGKPDSAQGWAGIYWQYPRGDWGTDPRGGRDLRGCTSVTFYARGDRGGERITFQSGGISGRYGDTMPKRGFTAVLGTSWQAYTIDLSGADLSRVVGVFGWIATRADNPRGATFYLDDIRLNG